MYGQGFGEPFVHTNTGGTVIKSVTNAPVLADILGTASSSNGTIEIDHIRFDGTSNTTVPVVKLQSFYGLSSFHNNVIYQRGTGGGFFTAWGAGVFVYENWAMNGDWNTFSLGAARTGIGFEYAPTADNGLVTFTKNSSRGWLAAFQLGNGAGVAYSPTVEKCECSVVRNGIVLLSTNKAVIDSNYLEGGDGGTGIYDTGEYTTISNNLIFSGFAVGVNANTTTKKGTVIEGNIVALGAVANAIGIDVASSAAFGGYNKNVVNNSITYTAGTAGVNGIKISGTDPRMNVIGNSFDPRGVWTGAATYKINDTSSNGVFGLIQKDLGDYEIPVLSNGAIGLMPGPTALVQGDVSANILTIPSAGSYFTVNATGAATVLKISAGVMPGRIVLFRTDTANMTFADGAYMTMASGASFTGPGMLTLLVDRIGGDNYCYEIARVVF